MASMDAKAANPEVHPLMDTQKHPLIQGNVLRPFGRLNAVYLFVRFDEQPLNVRPVLNRLLTRYVTSAAQQKKTVSTGDERNDQTQQSQQVQQSPQRWDGVGMFGLSGSGYKRLGLPAAAPKNDALGADLLERGMRDPYSPEFLWKPELDFWEGNYRDPIDAFLLLAHDSIDRLEEETKYVKAKLSEIGEIVAEERGGKIRGEKKVEQFGFLDGVSSNRDREFVFTPETPFSDSSEVTWGCFATFLKIEQNVLKFQRDSEAISTKAREQGIDITPERVQELAVGRQKNGTPLVSALGLNDFDFTDVPEQKCPFHAHIRVMNGRGAVEAEEEPVRIIRRGMAYGQRHDLSAGARQLPPSAGAGVLFLSLHKNLYDFVGLMMRAQKRRDPVLLRNRNQPAAQEWSFDDGTGKIQTVEHPMTDLTTIRGGEYFYIPSMRFIESLASNQAVQFMQKAFLAAR